MVLDSNVLLAGLAIGGLCQKVIELCLGKHEIVVSQHIIDEVQRHYSGKFSPTPEGIREAAVLLHLRCTCVTPAHVPLEAFSDPDDLPVLGTAVAAGAEVLVTGDKPLAALGEYQGIPIRSPRAFLDGL